MADEYLSIPQAAGIFKINAETIRRWVRKGVIPHLRIGPEDGGVIRVRYNDMVKVIDNRQSENGDG